MRHSHVLALAVVAGGLGALGACSDSSGPRGPILPDSAIPYVLVPSLITYEYTDSTGGTLYQLHWLSNDLFLGYNCLGFIPDAAPGDTVGRFYFGILGPNQGNIARTQETVTDTTLGYLLPTGVGTHGTFVVRDGNQLLLNWEDGDTPSRYFDPAADMRFVGDTLWSSLDLRFRADSQRVIWRVAWIQEPCQ